MFLREPLTAPSKGRDLRLAYLTSRYPCTSHTFIAREVSSLRDLGVVVETFSIRSPFAAELSDEALRAEADRTFTVLVQKPSTFLAAHLSTITRRPVAYLRTLALAIRHRPPGLRGFGLSLAHFAEAVLLAAELRRRRSSRLHNHFANSAATVGYLATRLLQLPWSFTVHGISETDYPAGLLLGRKIEAASFVACVSYFGRAQAMRLVAPEHWRKLRVVRCGLPLDALPRRSRKRSRKRIVSVGRLSAEKGQAGLLWAFAQLAHDHADTELLIVGDGPLAGELRSYAEKLCLGERIRFTGRLSETDTLIEIANADLLVLASLMEGLPIVLMEAMALGTAVIASHVAGIPELIEDGTSGLLFTPSDWTELQTCMRRLLNDDDLRERLAEAGRDVVAANFDVRESAEQLRELFASWGEK